jgi:hypothetical protein
MEAQRRVGSEVIWCSGLEGYAGDRGFEGGKDERSGGRKRAAVGTIKLWKMDGSVAVIFRIIQAIRNTRDLVCGSRGARHGT